MRKDKLEKKLNPCPHLHLPNWRRGAAGNNREGLGLLGGIYEGKRTWDWMWYLLDTQPVRWSTLVPFIPAMKRRQETNTKSRHCAPRAHITLPFGAMRVSHRGETFCPRGGAWQMWEIQDYFRHWLCSILKLSHGNTSHLWYLWYLGEKTNFN